jgi:PPOX class probable F420-dependent enzyme
VTPAVHLTPEQRVFVLERHVATLATLRPDGTPHVVPIAFTWDPERGEAWMTTEDGSVKVRNVEAALAAGRPARGALCQVAGGRWLTLEGTLVVSRDPADVALAERRHAVRYPPLEPDARRVVLRLAVDRVLGSAYMTR